MNEITHALLLELGFSEIPDWPLHYSYKGQSGMLAPELNLFVFHGFSLPISKALDLRYILMLIDYQEEASFSPYRFDLN